MSGKAVNSVTRVVLCAVYASLLVGWPLHGVAAADGADAESAVTERAQARWEALLAE
ncbi:MAG: hypothetical protein U5L11_00385 [Arhodomonas sp.]|nr:hypothetical protein [Arhodomonas sp.]